MMSAPKILFMQLPNLVYTSPHPRACFEQHVGCGNIHTKSPHTRVVFLHKTTRTTPSYALFCNHNARICKLHFRPSSSLVSNYLPPMTDWTQSKIPRIRLNNGAWTTSLYVPIFTQIWCGDKDAKVQSTIVHEIHFMIFPFLPDKMNTWSEFHQNTSQESQPESQCSTIYSVTGW